MGLTLAQPPEGGLSAVGRALDHLGAPFENATGEALRPIPLYRIGETALNAANPLKAALRFGWRYIVRDSEGAATVDITDEERPQLLRMSRGDKPKRLLSAAARAEAASGAEEQEVRILAFDQLSEEILWLTAPKGDRFISLAGGRSLGTPALLRRERARVRGRAPSDAAPMPAFGFEPDTSVS
ncbi:MAG TPA: hypothetical protein VGB70_11585 [Allosphingosinicella sp.]|jgi:hypothetical protein